MEASQKHIDLFSKMLAGTCSQEDANELIDWISERDTELGLLVMTELENSGKSYVDAVIRARMLDLLPGIMEPKEAMGVSFIPAKHFLKTTWFRYAAILLLIAGAAAYLFFTFPSLYRKDAEVTKNKEASKPQDIPPGGNKAMLTLSDGSTIVLDSAANGPLAKQGNSNVVKRSNGQVIYENDNQALRHENKMAYNIISTPKGGQYQVVLPDGSKVWLNAASSICFPAMFTNRRRVTVTGEVYFEIAADKSRPFFVEAGDMDVQVLGTSFNINAYTDEAAVKTSLLEGSVRIGQTILKPGEAFMAGKVVGTDIQQDLAWKNGAFQFNRTPVSAVLRQIARWYDLEITYAGNIPAKEFTGDMDRALSLSQVLIGLKALGLSTELKGRQLIVSMP